MASISSEEHAQRLQQIQLWIASHAAAWLELTEFEPGSDEKIAVMAARYQKACALKLEPSLHHQRDAPVHPDFGYKITVGPNGRIINKVRVPIDQANAQLIAVAEQVSILEEIRQSLETKK